MSFNRISSAYRFCEGRKDVSATDMAVLIALAHCENSETHQCFPSDATIAKMTHLKSATTVLDARKRLKDAKIIFWEPTRRKDGKNDTNDYTFLFPEFLERPRKESYSRRVPVPKPILTPGPSDPALQTANAPSTPADGDTHPAKWGGPPQQMGIPTPADGDTPPRQMGTNKEKEPEKNKNLNLNKERKDASSPFKNSNLSDSFSSSSSGCLPDGKTAPERVTPAVGTALPATATESAATSVPEPVAEPKPTFTPLSDSEKMRICIKTFMATAHTKNQRVQRPNLITFFAVTDPDDLTEKIEAGRKAIRKGIATGRLSGQADLTMYLLSLCKEAKVSETTKKNSNGEDGTTAEYWAKSTYKCALAKELGL